MSTARGWPAIGTSRWALLWAVLGILPSIGCGEQGAALSMCTDSPLWAGLRPGSREVGFMRDTIAGPASPIEIFEWYPAQSGSPSPCVRFDDYVAASLPGADGDVRARSLAERMATDAGDVPPAVRDRILSTTTAARADIARDRGRYPLVLWSARHETVPAQSVLSEYLASNGFVVAAVERADARLPAPYEIADRTRRLSVLMAQLADLELALDSLLRSPGVDSARVAVLAWSYGGESATALQRRRDEVDLVIGLSSNIADGWVYQVTDTLPVRAEGRRVPMVLLTEDTTAQSVIGGDAVTVVMFPELAHGNFNVVEGLLPGLFPEVTGHQPWSRGGLEAVEGYRAISEAVLARLRTIRD